MCRLPAIIDFITLSIFIGILFKEEPSLGALDSVRRMHPEGGGPATRKVLTQPEGQHVPDPVWERSAKGQSGGNRASAGPGPVSKSAARGQQLRLVRM